MFYIITLKFLQVFAASSAGFKCTGFEINSILVVYARSKAHWEGLSPGQVTFVKKDFWTVRHEQKTFYFFKPAQNCSKTSFLLSKTDLSAYNNVTAFLAPGVVRIFILLCIF